MSRSSSVLPLIQCRCRPSCRIFAHQRQQRWLTGISGALRKLCQALGRARYFEHVHLSNSLLTSRWHGLFRAMFGDCGGEALTTLAAFFQMCEEARAVGRSLYDAEQICLDLLLPRAL